MSQTSHPGADLPGGRGVAVWHRVAWRTAVTLGLVALARPVVDVVARAAHADLGARLPLAIVLAISLVWVGVVTVRDRTPAVPTLVTAGLVQAFAGAVLSLGTTWVFDGVPGGPLVRPTQLLVTLGAGALWGLVCGAVALALQNARRDHRGDRSLRS